MTQQKLLKLLGLLCLIGLTFSCRKTDKTGDQKTDENLVARFLTLPPSTTPEVRRIAAFLKRKNEKTGFLNEMAKRDGFALWDKAIMTPKTTSSKTMAARSASAGDTIIFIPLALENANHVNAFIFAKLDDSISLRLYRANDYASYGFGTIQDSTNNAEKLAVQFMLLDLETFGHSSFKVLDDRLLKDNSIPMGKLTKDKKVHVQHVTTSQQNRGSSFEVWEYEVCTSIRYLDCHGCGRCSDGSCSACQEICWKTSTTCTKTSILVSVDDGWYPSGGITNPNNGGGGPTGSTPTGPTQCNPSPLLDNGFLPCPHGNTTGWLPELEEPFLTPCEIAQKGAKKMDSLFNVSKADSVLASIPNLQAQIHENGFPIYVNYAVNPYNVHDTAFSYSTGGVQTGTDSSIIITTVTTNLNDFIASLHTHPSSDYAAQSAKDIYELLQESSQNPHFQGAFVAAANGSQYAITINDPTKANTFLATMAQNLDGAKWKEDSDIGKAFKDASDFYSTKIFKGNPNKLNLAYEMAMAAVLNQYNVGVTLNKKDASGNFKPLVVKTTIPNPNKPNKREYSQDCL